MNQDLDTRHTISTHHLQQHELVKFLYDRFTVGMFITLVVALVAASLAAYELEIQDREHWVYLWLGGILIMQYGRYMLKKAYDRVKNEDYLTHALWKRRFVIGVYSVALWQGIGAVLIMPYITFNLQIIFHAFLLGMGAGAIAYLATSMMIYASYLILMILPMAVYLFWAGTPDSFVLGFMYMFMIVTYFFGVKRMNWMISEALNLRFDNELLVNDLQRLLNAVAKSNKALDKLSTTDELTGASNFRAFRVRLEEQRLKHINSKLPLSLSMVNIDYYYEYNEFYGQDIGNRTLTAIAHLMMGEIIHNDEMVARINGAEFAVLLPSVSCEGARMMMENVMDLIKEQDIEHKKSRVESRVTLSIGICCIPLNEEISARDLISRTEGALRAAKQHGRNQIEIVNS